MKALILKRYGKKDQLTFAEIAEPVKLHPNLTHQMHRILTHP
jgi:hypothetical protein